MEEKLFLTTNRMKGLQADLEGKQGIEDLLGEREAQAGKIRE